MLPMEKSVTFTGACTNDCTEWIARSFVKKAKEGGYVRIVSNLRQVCGFSLISHTGILMTFYLSIILDF
jgi:hypothetical protein